MIVSNTSMIVSSSLLHTSSAADVELKPADSVLMLLYNFILLHNSYSMNVWPISNLCPNTAFCLSLRLPAVKKTKFLVGILYFIRQTSKTYQPFMPAAAERASTSSLNVTNAVPDGKFAIHILSSFPYAPAIDLISSLVTFAGSLLRTTFHISSRCTTTWQ